MTNETEKLRIHFIYCMIILVMILIAVATDRWTAQQKFTEYLSNAATMTSLVLALVAIFYSFIANDGLSKSLGNIATVSSDVKEAKDQISDYLTVAKESGDATKESAALIHRVSNDVGANLTSLTGTLSAIRTQTDSLYAAMSGLPVRLDELETKVIDATKQLGEKRNVPPVSVVPTGIDASAVKRFLELSTLSANLLTYACVLARKKGARLSIPAFCTAIETNLVSYMNGFLTCMKAAQLVDTKYVPESDRAFDVLTVHPTLEEATRTYFVSFVERAFKDKPDTLNAWLAKLKSVDALYA